MSNVIEFKKPDFLSYVQSESGDITGVKCKGLEINRLGDFATFETWGGVPGTMLTMEEANQMCIAWLCLHNPDVIKSDS